VGLVADETHRKDVAQGDCDEIRMLADKQLEPTCEVFIRRLFHFGFPFFLLNNDHTVRAKWETQTVSTNIISFRFF
jgi:hypothetical protein